MVLFKTFVRISLDPNVGLSLTLMRNKKNLKLLLF
jgi:hypothetical protein